MWAYAIAAPGRLERVEAPRPDPGPGRVLVRLPAGGICGSDLPSFAGRRNAIVVPPLSTGAPPARPHPRRGRAAGRGVRVEEAVWNDAAAWASDIDEPYDIVVEAIDRARALEHAREDLRAHRAPLEPCITTVMGVHDARAAFETALRPAAGRLKVVLEV